MTSRSSRLIGSAPLLAALACSPLPDAEPRSTVSDSAGVEIVHSNEPMWLDGEGWQLSGTPILQIGSMEGEEPYLLDRVMGVARLEDGRVAVAMMGDNTIRFYDSDGRYLSRVGGSGEGPGEFSQLMSLERTPGKLYGNEYSRRPLMIFDEATGGFIGTLTPPVIEGFSGAYVGSLFEDGSMLFSDTPQGVPMQSGAYTMNSTVIRATEAGWIDTLGVFPAYTFVAVGTRFPTWQEYGPRLQVVAAGSQLYQAYSAEYEISVRDLDGTLVRSIRRAWDPIPVTEEDQARYRDGLLNLGAESGREVPARMRQTNEDIANAMVFPEHHPAYDGIHVDRVGHLWVLRTDLQRTTSGGFTPVPDTPTWWDVFDLAGIWLGGVELPDRFLMREIGEDYVAGVWKNEFDVEFVRIYRIFKPGT